jgi:hypothetical protein
LSPDTGYRIPTVERSPARAIVRVALAAVAAAFVLNGCSSDGGQARASTAAATPSAGVTTGCSAGDVEWRVRTFSRSLRDANLGYLDKVWGDRFKWFTVGVERRNGKVDQLIDARTPQAALDAVKRADGLPVRMQVVQFNGRYRGAADFQYDGRWGARKQSGKGNMLCGSPEIRVWSMVVRTRP